MNDLFDDLDRIAMNGTARDRKTERTARRLVRIAADPNGIESLGREILWGRIRAFAYGMLVGLLIGAAIGVVVGAIVW